MNTLEALKQSPPVQVFEINQKDAIEVWKFIDEKTKEGLSRKELLKIANEQYTGKKLLFAVSIIEFTAGFSTAILAFANTLTTSIIHKGDEA